MTIINAILARNLRLFFRDRMAVFFSLLAALILFCLYTLFLGHLQMTDLSESFPAATAAEVRAFVTTWMVAGVISMTAITTGLGALGVLVEDVHSGRFRDFVVSPVRATQMVVSYFLSAWVVSLAMSFVVLGVCLAYLWLAEGTTIPPSAVLRAGAIVVITAAAFSALAAWVTSVVRTPAAYAALCTIVGTVLGFLTGAYIPVGSLPEPVRAVINTLPFGQASLLMRRELASETLDAVVAAVPQGRGPLRTYYGLDAAVAGWPITPSLVVAVLIACTVAFAALGAMRIHRRMGSALIRSDAQARRVRRSARSRQGS